ncbi:MAG: helix-turn-helix domain-containing protein [Actinomycetota bacterium]|nr:helix-turn-helix domain-containing protein [Actinomycetota bacterium]
MRFRLTDGVFVPARTAALLSRMLDLDRHRPQWRGSDAELDAVLLAWRQVVVSFTNRQTDEARTDDGFTNATRDATDPEPATDCTQQMTSKQVADLLGVTEQAVTKATRSQRLNGRWIAGRWLYDREDVALYKAKRSSAA